jgi:hypothetical protein
MLRVNILSFIFIFIMVLGCQNPYGSFEKKANQVNALSKLKQFQAYTTMYYEENNGFYGRLNDDGTGIDEAFYKAWDKHTNPEPLSGYLFSHIETGLNGLTLNLRERIGLCAYPFKPGKTGDFIYCALADLRVLEKKFSGMAQGFTSGAEEWTVYKAQYKDLGGPVHAWPAEEDLHTIFQPINKKAPQEGLDEARKLFDTIRKQP